MKSIGKSKITRLRPKKNIEYPLIRFPQSYAHLAGGTAHIFEIDNNGKPLFVISLDENFDGNLEVIQPSDNSALETRLASLEQRILELQKPQSSGSEKPDGPGEIRTPDLCRVKATS